MLLQVDQLSKRYGSKQALQAVSFSIKKGKIVGVLGENGAGKSTLFRILAGLTRPSSGQFLLGGLPPGVAMRERLAFAPDTIAFPLDLRIDHLFDFLNVMYPGWKLNKARRHLNEWKLNLTQQVGQLSHGQQARLKILCAYCQPADLILLDEPLGGIDPVNRQRVLEMFLREFKSSHQSILLATHLVSEVEPYLDEVIFLQKGQIAMSGSRTELANQHGKTLFELFAEVVS